LYGADRDGFGGRAPQDLSHKADSVGLSPRLLSIDLSP